MYDFGSESLLLLSKLHKKGHANKVPTVIYTAIENSSELNVIKSMSECDEIVKKPASKIEITAVIQKLLKIKTANKN